MKKLGIIFSALLALSACSSPEELYIKLYEISEVKAGETLIEYQQKYINIAQELLNLSDEEFAKEAEHRDFSQGCINNPSDSWGWQFHGNSLRLPNCFNLCRDKDLSLATDITEAYTEVAKAIQAKYETAFLHEPEVMISYEDYAAQKRDYISTKLGACEYECELALAEIYIDWLEVYKDLMEHKDFDRFRVEVLENVDDYMNGKGFWASQEYKESRDNISKKAINDRIKENHQVMYSLEKEISKRNSQLR